MNPVSAQIHRHLIAVAVKGVLLVPPDQLGIAVFVRPGFRDQVDQRRVVGGVHECVVVEIDQLVICIVKGQRIAVFPFQDDGAVLAFNAQVIVRIFFQLGLNEVQQLRPFHDLHIGQIVHAVDEDKGEFLIQRVLGR